MKASEAAPTRKRLRAAIDSQRSESLRRCRNRVDPAALGLPPSRRKRTTGLEGELEEAPADVVRLIQSLGIPAVAMNLCWDILAWNPLSRE